MCELCESDLQMRNKARQNHREFANKLIELASDYKMYADGIIKPHTDRAKQTAHLANAVIRRLVEDYI